MGWSFGDAVIAMSINVKSTFNLRKVRVTDTAPPPLQHLGYPSLASRSNHSARIPTLLFKTSSIHANLPLLLFYDSGSPFVVAFAS
jgi:hypothetical protein